MDMLDPSRSLRRVQESAGFQADREVLLNRLDLQTRQPHIRGIHPLLYSVVHVESP